MIDQNLLVLSNPFEGYCYVCLKVHGQLKISGNINCSRPVLDIALTWNIVHY